MSMAKYAFTFNRALSLRNAGKTYQQIADLFGVSKGRVHRLLNVEKHAAACKRYRERNAEYRIRQTEVTATYRKSLRGRVVNRMNAGRFNAERYGYKPCSATVEEIVSAYNGKCKLCGKSADSRKHLGLVIDHCHKTGKFRGWLCTSCNVGLGLVLPSKSMHRKAGKYLGY